MKMQKYFALFVLLSAGLMISSCTEEEMKNDTTENVSENRLKPQHLTTGWKEFWDWIDKHVDWGYPDNDPDTPENCPGGGMCIYFNAMDLNPQPQSLSQNDIDNGLALVSVGVIAGEACIVIKDHEVGKGVTSTFPIYNDIEFSSSLADHFGFSEVTLHSGTYTVLYDEPTTFPKGYVIVDATTVE
jgi:hypothetical protein